MNNLYWKLWAEYWTLIARVKGHYADPLRGITEGVQGTPPPEVPSKVPLVTVIGDSSANHFAQRAQREAKSTIWNYGINSATIDYFMPEEMPPLKNVVLMVGGNNVGLFNESAATIVRKHLQLHNRIRSLNTIVVGLSPVNGTEGFAPWKNKVIREVNWALKLIHGELFVDTFPPAMIPSFTDGVHHTWKYDEQIIRKVAEIL